MTGDNEPTVVLVHGAWADGSSWRRVIGRLLAAGIRAVAVQNPTSSLVADVAATARVLASIDGPVVLVGHSWGGAVITEAGDDPRVQALVFVAALPPAVGQSVGDLVASHPAPPGLSRIEGDATGDLRLSVDGWIHDVGQDLPEHETRVLAALQPPLAATTFGDRITKAAWMTKPTWYVVSRDDRIVGPELQRALAATLQATTVEVAASHLSPLSMPDAVTEVIVDAVEAVRRGSAGPARATRDADARASIASAS